MASNQKSLVVVVALAAMFVVCLAELTPFIEELNRCRKIIWGEEVQTPEAVEKALQDIMAAFNEQGIGGGVWGTVKAAFLANGLHTKLYYRVKDLLFVCDKSVNYTKDAMEYLIDTQRLLNQQVGTNNVVKYLKECKRRHGLETSNSRF